MNPQMYAVQIEHIMSSVFNCERFGIGGIVNSDCIRINPIYSMFLTLTYIYAGANSELKKEIENFIQDNYYYSKWSIDEILEFDSDTHIVDGSEYSLGYSNGIEAISCIIDKFEDLCK